MESKMELTPIFNKLATDLKEASDKLRDAFVEFTRAVGPGLQQLAALAEQLEKELEANGYVEGPGDGPEGVNDGDSGGHSPEDDIWGDPDPEGDDTPVPTEA